MLQWDNYYDKAIINTRTFHITMFTEDETPWLHLHRPKYLNFPEIMGHDFDWNSGDFTGVEKWRIGPTARVSRAYFGGIPRRTLHCFLLMCNISDPVIPILENCVKLEQFYFIPIDFIIDLLKGRVLTGPNENTFLSIYMKSKVAPTKKKTGTTEVS